MNALYLNTSNNNAKSIDFDVDNIECFQCDTAFSKDGNYLDQIQTHLLAQHKLIIADIKQISNLGKYCHYWKQRLGTNFDLSRICAVIKTNR